MSASPFAPWLPRVNESGLAPLPKDKGVRQRTGPDPIDSLLRLLLRFFLVPVGYFLAVLAGAAVIVIGEWQVGSLFQTQAPDELMMGIMLATVTSVGLLVVLLSSMWLVAAVGILFAELFAVRSWIFHAANGVVSAWIGAQLPGEVLVNGQVDPAAVVGNPLYVIAAGLAGGLVYWLVAGSSAGFYKPVLRSARMAAEARRTPSHPPAPPQEQAPRKEDRPQG